MNHGVERVLAVRHRPRRRRAAGRALMASMLVLAICAPGSERGIASGGPPRGGVAECPENAVQIGELVLATQSANIEFGTSEVPAIPADFFDPGSLPFEGNVGLRASPYNPMVTNADMSVNRKETAFVGSIGSSGTVDIEIVELNLVSIEPITVTVGTETQQWNLEVTLTSDTPPVGEMTIDRTHIDGGDFDATLPVCPVFTFIRVSDDAVRVLEHCDGSPPIVFSTGGVPWEFDLPEPNPSPSHCMYLPPGTAAFWVSSDLTGPSLLTTEQAIGLVDCNQNLLHDTADILEGRSFDVNGNDIPDECECPGDVGGASAGAIDVVDLLAVLGAWGPCPEPCPPVCPEDVNQDCVVDVLDLLDVLGAWGPCPE